MSIITDGKGPLHGTYKVGEPEYINNPVRITMYDKATVLHINIEKWTPEQIKEIITIIKKNREETCRSI